MNERFEDTPELFGDGAGGSTCGDIECEFCGAKYNEGEDERGIYDGESVGWTEFAGLCACECCFAKIEAEVLRRMDRIVPWYERWLDRRLADCNRRQAQMDRLDKSIGRPGSVFVVIGKESGLPIGNCLAEDVLGLIEETPGLRFEPFLETRRVESPELFKEKPMKAGQKRYWAILSRYSGEVIGKCMDKDVVLSEEPKAKFREISREEYFRDT